MILIGTVVTVALIFFINEKISLFMIYVMGMTGSLGMIVFFTAHRWNKKKKYDYKTNTESNS
jgi:hypothetical protein